MGTNVSGGLIGNYVLSADGTRLYHAGRDGVFRTFDAITGALIQSNAIGHQLGAIALSPDGAFVMITEQVPASFVAGSGWPSNVTQSSVYKVNLGTGAVQTFTYTSTGSDYVLADVVITSAGKAMFTQNILPGWSGWTPIVTLDLASGAFTESGPGYYQAGSLTASADSTSFLYGQLALSSAEARIFNAAGQSLFYNGIYQNNVYGYAQGIEAYTGSGPDGRVAISTGGRVHLWTGVFGYLQDLSAIHSGLANASGLTFSADKRYLHVLSSDASNIYTIRMSDYALLETVTTGVTGGQVTQWGEELTLTGSEGAFLINTGSGIVRIDRPDFTTAGTSGDDLYTGIAHRDNYAGGDGKDRILGLAGDDTLDGGMGDDHIDGGTGADRMIGGTGDDFFIVDDAGDVVVENGGEGFDTVETAIANYVLPANVERVVYTGAGAVSWAGSAGNDSFTGNGGNDLFNLSQGGSDTSAGGDGNDGFYFGGAFDPTDSVDGGAGTLDQIGLQGSYGGLTFGANATVGVEAIVLLAGDDTRFANLGGALTSYNLTLVDANVAAGATLSFQANTLRAGENFTLDASAEINGKILTFGGLGTEVLTGSQGDDGFYFGAGRFGAGERLNGGGGFDSVGLQGSYAGANAITFGADQLTSIEIVVLLSGNDSRFGGSGTPFSYTLTMNDGNVAAGGRLAIQANTLAAGEVLRFDGSAETDGILLVYGGAGDDVMYGGQGADELHGGAGADFIVGQGGADTLRGALGNDVFLYRGVSDSAASASDRILDFASGDLIDLSVMDSDVAAGNQRFAFIGADAFTAAGQLRVVQTGSNARVEGDVDGDGAADFAIDVTVADGHLLTIADFRLDNPANAAGPDKLGWFADADSYGDMPWMPETNWPTHHLTLDA